MLYNLEKESLKRHMVNKILTRIVEQTPGMENMKFSRPMTSTVANFLGFNYDGVKKSIGDNCATESDILMGSLIKSVEDRVERFATKCYSLDIPDKLFGETGTENSIIVNEAFYRSLVGLEKKEENDPDSDDDDDEKDPFGSTVTDEDIEESAEKSESTIAVMVSDLIKEIIKADASEVQDLAEKVVELSKSDAEANKDIAEGDEDTFGTTKKGEDDDDKEDPFSDDDEGKDGDKKGKKGSDKGEDEGDDGSNPFDDGDDSGSEGSDGDDPFSDNKDKGKGKEEGKDDDDKSEGSKKNPFDDDGEEETDKTGEENANQKLIKELKVRTFGLEKLVYNGAPFKPFEGLENGSFNSLGKHIADKIYGEELTNQYNNFGIESEGFKVVRKQYKDTALEAVNAAVAVVITASLLNVGIEKFKLNNVSLFTD